MNEARKVREEFLLDLGTNALPLTRLELEERLRPRYGAKTKQKADELLELWQIKSKCVSPRGHFKNMPDLLDQKRLAHGITDHFFRRAATFDRIHVWQLPEGDGEKTEGGIIKPEMTLQYEAESAPQGVLLSAGSAAMDALYSDGVEVGDTVILNQVSPFRFVVGRLGGQELEMLLLRAGDICGSIEKQERIRSGEIRFEAKKFKDDRGLTYIEHVMIKNGEAYGQVSPWIPTDQ